MDRKTIILKQLMPENFGSNALMNIQITITLKTFT